MDESWCECDECGDGEGILKGKWIALIGIYHLGSSMVEYGIVHYCWGSL
jgi:hypothetical protein